jgi:hypothetical protein
MGNFLYPLVGEKKCFLTREKPFPGGKNRLRQGKMIPRREKSFSTGKNDCRQGKTHTAVTVKLALISMLHSLIGKQAKR